MGVRPIVRERMLILACSFVFFNAAFSLTVPRSHLLTTVGDLTQCLLLSVVLFCFLANTKQTEQRAKFFWGLLALGAGFWLIAQILWTYFEVLLGREVPNPFVGDVVLFLHLVPMMAALALQPDRDRSEAGWQVGSLDFTLLLLWWLYLYLFVVIPWQYVAPNEVLYGRSFDFVYLLEHFVFLACVSAAWLRSNGTWKVIYGHLLGAASLYAMGSMAASFAIDFGTYYTGSLYDVPLVIAMAWFAGMALVAQRLNPHAETTKVVQPKRTGWVSALAMVALLSLPAMAGWALYVNHSPSSVRNFRVILTLITMMAMGTLTWLKQRRLDKELARANQELREDSLTDLLTGVRNRRFFASTIAADAKQAIRAYSGPDGVQPGRNQDLVFYLIDADSFKDVNDRYGHDTGDELLVQIAQRISTAIRYSDVLIRWGGDEFLVLSRYTDRTDSHSLAARVLKALGSEPFQLKCGSSLRSTCSIGWAVFPWFVRQTEVIPYEEVLRLADCALYEAKKAGRNRAIGMLPSKDQPELETSKPGGKSDRLTEQLGARMIHIEGTTVASNSRTPAAKAMIATQAP
ncbi:MAG TPA: GGDEF domain-containing protein [Terriglobales bacterium]|nr:GGDEF domain-containing protein [Terriglobales bacterium]